MVSRMEIGGVPTQEAPNKPESFIPIELSKRNNRIRYVIGCSRNYRRYGPSMKRPPSFEPVKEARSRSQWIIATDEGDGQDEHREEK